MLPPQREFYQNFESIESCANQKKASFSNHICPCAFTVNRRILAAQKKTHHHFCKRCLAPQIQFGQKRFRENASIQGAQARESNCNSFEELHPAEVHWLTEATLLLLHLLLLSHTLVIMMNFEGIMVFPLDIKEANTKITTWIVWQIQNTPQPASLYLHHK